MIKIKIPNELKEIWEQDKETLQKLGSKKKYHIIRQNIIIIDKAINENDIVLILERIHKLTLYQQTGVLGEIRFHYYYQNWLEFTLIELLKSKGIIIKNNVMLEDMYLSLGVVNKLLRTNYKLKDIKKEAIRTVYSLRENYSIDFKIKDMVELFIDIGLMKIKPEELIDISYNNYLENKKHKIFSKG